MIHEILELLLNTSMSDAPCANAYKSLEKVVIYGMQSDYAANSIYEGEDQMMDIGVGL